LINSKKHIPDGLNRIIKRLSRLIHPTKYEKVYKPRCINKRTNRSKIKYKNQFDAEVKAIIMTDEKKKRYVSYRCPYCGYYHVGKK